jgi:hypothetical protein
LAHDLAPKTGAHFSGSCAFVAHDLFPETGTHFSDHAPAEKKCAASPGGTFFILFQSFALSTRGAGAPTADSNSPQAPILKEKLLVDGIWGLQTLARESLHIVAFWYS